MKKSTLTITLLLVGFLLSSTQAQTLQFAKTLHKDWTFIENKGQLADENGKLLSDIKYYGKDKGVNIYCRQQSLSFVFTKTTFKEKTKESIDLPSKNDMPEIDKVDYERMDMNFIGCNANAQIATSGQKKDYLNFYLAHTPEEGITNVHQFEKLTYKNIYNKIDLVLYIKEQGMKYEFIIYPGGKVDDIKIKWEGITPELLENGGIKYTNALGFLNEAAPFSFLQSGENLSSKFKRNTDGSISFETGNFDENKILVIDPTFQWGTYFGGSGNESGSANDIDSIGNVYINGSTSGTSGIATSGAYQTSFAGGNVDAYIAKFNGSGNIQWATYYGGSDDDYGNGIVSNKSGTIYISGKTKSSSGIATSGAYQTTNGGYNDGFIAKFSNSGSRQWATYYGGTDDDDCGTVCLDDTGNVYISGNTYSTSGIASSGTFQTSIGGGQDSYIVKFSSSGSRIWATYFGGSNSEGVSGISLGNTGNIYLTGNTNSTSGISTSGAYQTSLGGSSGIFDAYIEKFSNNGVSRIWGTYFGGALNDGTAGIKIDSSENVYIAGRTSSTSGIATSGAYQTSYGGGSTDGFISKFNGAGNIQWATYFGGSGADVFSSPDLDIAENLFFTGYTSSTSGIVTSGAYQTSYGGGFEDAFIAKFNGSGSRIWATYYGGTVSDVGNGISIDKNSNLFVLGKTLSTSGIASSGAYQTTFGGGLASYGDAFIVKFKDCISSDSTITKAVCDSFVLNNITYKTTGTFKQYFTNAVNCDSTVTLILTIKKTASTLTQTGCDSLVINAVIYKTSGTFTQKLTNAAGCDSTITLNLTIKKSSTATISQSACDSLVINTITYKNSSTYTQKITNTAGCDSTITLNLTIKKSSSSTMTQTACDSIVLNSIMYKSTGTYTQKKTNAAGCDSIITLNLTIKKSTGSTSIITACDSFVLNSITYKITGTYTQKKNNAVGCDSNINLNLTIKKSSSFTITQTVCDSLVLNSITYKLSGTYIQKRTNAAGCDSTITLNLTIKKSTTSTVTQTACDSFVLNSITYKLTGTYIQKKTNAAGCDSTITLNLIIKKSSSSTITQTSCDSFVLNSITYKASGTYAQKRNNAALCDSIITLNLTINKAPDARFSASVTNFTATFIPNELVGKSYLWRFGNGDTSVVKIPTYTYPVKGNYLVKLKVTSFQDCENTHDSTIAIQTIGIGITKVYNNVRLYPNPAKNEVRVLGLTEQATITMMDATGRIISLSDPDSYYIINTSNLSKGIYLVNISNRKMNLTKKLVIE